MPVRNEDLRRLLISLQEKDTALRRKILNDGVLYEGYQEALEALHIEHAKLLNGIMEEHGWPGISLVGKAGSVAAFTIAQHAISLPQVQKSCLRYLNSAVKAGEASAVQLACLEDRILFNEGKPQKYGMIFDWNEKGELYTNVDNIESANERRMLLGLKSVEEAIKIHRREIEEEGGGAPADILEHKRKESAWAKRVGWR